MASLSFAGVKTVFIWTLLASLLSASKLQRSLAVENLALRQQVIMLQRSVKRAHPSTVNRSFWIAFIRFVGNWRENVIALHPDMMRAEER